MKHSSSAGGVIIGPGDKVLVVSQHGTSWSLPKGTLEPGEAKLDTLRREIKEETGLTDYKVIRELGTYQRHLIGKHGGEDTSHLKTITIYLMTTPEQKLAPEDPENPEAKWVKPEEVADILTHPKDKAFYSGILPQVREFIAKNK